MVTAVSEEEFVAGNMLALEHVNIAVPDQQLAMRFYVDGLGFTRDPVSRSGNSTVWLDLGFTQFHLPVGAAQVLRGHVGLVLPGRAELLARLHAVADDLDGTLYGFGEGEEFIDVTSPWGNWLRCFTPDAEVHAVSGIAYVEFEIPPGAAPGIARFYAEVLGATTEVADDDGATIARCLIGSAQEFIFRESDQPLPAYDGHHVQVYLADINAPCERLSAHDLVYDHNDQSQYRFRDIIDPASGEVLFTIEHEIRNTEHPLYARLIEKKATA